MTPSEYETHTPRPTIYIPPDERDTLVRKFRTCSTRAKQYRVYES